MRRALPLAALALAAAPAGAQAAERVVDMPAKYFMPPNITTLAGDTVTWTNSDTVEHDVALIGGGFDSGNIAPGGRFSLTFAGPATTPTAARSTPSWRARSTSTRSSCSAPTTRSRSAARRRCTASRRPARPGADRVARAHGHGVGAGHRGRPGPDGSFRARVRRPRPTVYRAVADAGPSLPLPLKVGARLDTTVKRLKSGRYRIRATARPAQPGALAALQLYSRERFRWRQVAHATVGRDSRVRFKVRPPGRYAARVVILRGKARLRREHRPDAAHRRPREEHRARPMAPHMHHPM